MRPTFQERGQRAPLCGEGQGFERAYGTTSSVTIFGKSSTNRTNTMDGGMNASELRLPQVCAKVRWVAEFLCRVMVRRPGAYDLIRMLENESGRVWKIKGKGPLGDLWSKEMIQESTRPNKLNWRPGATRTKRRETSLEEASPPVALALEVHPKLTWSLPIYVPGRQWMGGHVGFVSVNQQNTLEQGREKRNSHRGWVLWLGGTRENVQKRQLLNCFHLKRHLNFFFSEGDRKGQELIYPLSFTLKANTEIESALWGKQCKVTAFTQLCPRSWGSRLTCEGLLFFPTMLIECADREVPKWPR